MYNKLGRGIYVVIILLTILNKNIAAQTNDIKMYVDSTEDLRVRKLPNINGERIGVLSYMDEVLVVQEDTYNVVIDGITGKWTLIRTRQNVEKLKIKVLKTGFYDPRRKKCNRLPASESCRGAVQLP